MSRGCLVFKNVQGAIGANHGQIHASIAGEIRSKQCGTGSQPGRGSIVSLQLALALVSKNRRAGHQVTDAAAFQIGERGWSLGVQCRRGLQLALTVFDQHCACGRDRDQIGESVIVEIFREHSRRVRRQGLERHRFVLTIETIAINDACAVAIRNRQVARGSIVPHCKNRAVHGVPGDEGKFRGLIAETGLAIVGDQRGMIAQQQQVEVAIVVVIDPKRLLVWTGRKFRGIFLKDPLAIVIQRGARAGQYAKVRQAIVIEISRRDTPDILQILQARFGWRFPVLIKTHAIGRPCDQIRMAIAVQIEQRHASRYRVEVIGQLMVSEFKPRWRLIGRLRLNRLVDFGVITPLHFLGNGGAGLALLDLLENLQLARRIFCSPRLPVLIEELKVRPG